MNGQLTHIDLFAGIGGFSLAAESCGFKTVLFCEIDEFCQRVLNKHWPEVPIIPDIRNIDGTKWRGVTLISGGFPCQPFSVAGQRGGKEDNRYLWPEMFRVIKEARPRWVLAENVSGIVKMALDEVLTDLEGEGYSTGTVIIPACAKNAPHRRDRVWIIANDSRSQKSRGVSNSGKKAISKIRQTNINAPDSPTQRLPKSQEGQFGEPVFHAKRNDRKSTDPISKHDDNGRYGAGENGGELQETSIIQESSWQIPWLEVATGFCRVDDGLPSWIYSDRVKRLKALGNAIVPQVAKEIIEKIAIIENGNYS